MLKPAFQVNEGQDVKAFWPARLASLLSNSPVVNDLFIESSPVPESAGGEATFRIGDEAHRLLIECKLSGQPRFIRDAVLHIGREVSRARGLARGIVVAPFISPASRAILLEGDMGWMDLAGNVRVVLPRFHLEINKADRDPFASGREQRSLFFPKSARLLKLLLHNPARTWKIADLTAGAGVSAGQVSNVRKALIDREWAQAETGGGFQLTKPVALLDAWRDAAQAPRLFTRGHTLKHGRALEAAIQDAFIDAEGQGVRLLLASHSVARRVAPFARIAGEFFYADAAGLALLKRHLQISPTDVGENVTIYKAEDEGLWQETTKLASAVKGTGPVQTYLDLSVSGGRGREAADHWRAEKIEPLLNVDAPAARALRR